MSRRVGGPNAPQQQQQQRMSYNQGGAFYGAAQQPQQQQQQQAMARPPQQQQQQQIYYRPNQTTPIRVQMAPQGPRGQPQMQFQQPPPPPGQQQPQQPQGPQAAQQPPMPYHLPYNFVNPQYQYPQQIPRMPAQMAGNQFFLYQPGMTPFSSPIPQGYSQPPPTIPNQAPQLRPQAPSNPAASMGQHVIAANPAYMQANPVATPAPGAHMQPTAHPQLSQAGIPATIQAQPMQPPTQQRVLERRVRQPLKIINPNTNEEVDPTANTEVAAPASVSVVSVASVSEEEKSPARSEDGGDASNAKEPEAKADVVVPPKEPSPPVIVNDDKPIVSSTNKSSPAAVAPPEAAKKAEAATAPIIHPASSSNDKAVVDPVTEDQQDGKSKQKSKKDTSSKPRRPSEPKEVPAKEPVEAADPQPPVVEKEGVVQTNNNVVKEPEVAPVIEASTETPENHVEGNHAVEKEEAVASEEDAAAAVASEAKEGSVENGTTSASSSNPASKSSSQIKLKYTYPEEQWSPINTEGKKQYDRNFLIELSKDPLSMRKPENLPPMDIIKDKPVHDKVYNAPQASQNKDWMPGFVKSTTSKSGMNTKGGSRDRSAKRPERGMGGNAGGGGGGPTVINIDRNFELHKTENAWKPVKLLESDVAELDPILELERNVRAILNKLTPQKFDKLVKQFNELTIDTQPKLEACIELIFEKAVDEPEFSVAYARLCEVLQKKKVDNDAAEAAAHISGGEPAPAAVNSNNTDFRKLIILRCQKEFERDYMEGFDKQKFEAQLATAESEDKRKELQLEFEEKERRARRRSLGNIRFIGELYKLKMLQNRTMHQIIQSLIVKIDEESLECLCWFLQTIGKDLEQSTMVKEALSKEDSSNNSQQNKKPNPIHNPFDEYFAALEKIIKENKSLPSRVRFLLQDAVDLRRSGWKPRREKAGPKTLDQIHKEAEREKTQQQLLDMKPLGGDRGGGNRGGGGQDRDNRNKRSSRGGPQQSNDDEWNTVPFNSRGSKTQSNSEKIDAQKIQSLASNRKDAENMSFGPSSRFWGKGSGSSAKPQNRFAPIQNSSDEGSRRGNFSSSASMGNFARGGHDRDGGSRGASMNERQGAIDTVRQFSSGMSSNGPVKGALGSSAHPAAGLQQVAGGPSMSMDGSNLANMPAPSTRDEAEMRFEQTKQLKGPPDMEPDIVKRKAKSVIEEFLHNCDLESAYKYVCSDFHPSVMKAVVEEWVDYVLEKHMEEMRKTGKLLNFLVKKHVLLPRQFAEGVEPILKIASDVAIDIPKFWDYIGVVIAGPLASESALPLKFLQESAKLLSDEAEVSKYVASVLKALVADIGPGKAGELWKRSGLTLNDFMHPDKVPSFIDQNKFQFINEQPPMSEDGLRKCLESILVEQDKPVKNDAVISWIVKNVPEETLESRAFIQTLTRVVTRSAIKISENSILLNEPEFEDRCQVLKRFVDAKMEREIQVLYALQVYMHELEHPTKMLSSIFNSLYNFDVISDTAFFKWLEDKEVEQDLGRGVAVKSTTQFFTWLQEPQDDE